MEKIEQKNRVSAIQAYLAGIGLTVSSVQGYEVLARPQGFRNKQTFAAASSPVTAKSAKSSTEGFPQAAETPPTEIVLEGIRYEVRKTAFTVPEMVERNWKFNVIISVDPDVMGNIDAFNEYVSKAITGNDCALNGIGYSVMPALNFGDGGIAHSVSGYVEMPEDHFDEVVTDDDKKFYAELLALCVEIGGASKGTMKSGEAGLEVDFKVRVTHSTNLAILREYANTQAGNHAEYLTKLNEPVLELESEQTRLVVTLSGLQHAVKAQGADGWWVQIGKGDYVAGYVVTFK